jgi:hypothetical protein
MEKRHLSVVGLVLAALACGVFDGGAPRLDAETLERLTLSMMSQSIQLQPGESHDFDIGVVECCYIFEPVEADVAWSVAPPQGASIDPETGLLTVDPATPSGSVFTVSADVENGRRIVTIDVYVYTAESNPLAVGIWREEAEFACETGEEITPEERIGELVFHADGTFSVTWMPFEVYRDYWGTYTFDPGEGTLELFVTGGNYVPDDIDGSGFFSIDDQGRLVLSDMWLGTGHEPSGTAICGHRFQH